jgi:hypothetical protein
LTVERLVVSWATAEPDSLAARLAALGFTLIDRRLLAFTQGEVRLVLLASGQGRERLFDPRWERPAGETHMRPGHANGVSDIVALGWATVDADRAAAATPLDPADAFTPLPDDHHLGARVRGWLARQPATLLLEPSTEGRLAATLARLGEGPAALYLVAGSGELGAVVSAMSAHISAMGAAAGRADVRPGPLGPAVLLPGGPAWGPHLLVVAERPATPEMTPSDRAPGTISP